MSVGSCRINKSLKTGLFYTKFILLYIIYIYTIILLITIYMQYTKDDEVEKLKNLYPNQ